MNRKHLRIVEDAESGAFMPQFYTGLFSRWKFLKPNADKSDTTWTLWLQEDDPNKAAKFAMIEEAKAFLDSFNANIDRLWQHKREAECRKRHGVPIKRAIDYEP